tara:strand:- start:7904 stop:8902 length:999 start_codon:yes stop_codon:yes gene_type:complete
LSLNLFTKNGLPCKVPEYEKEDDTPKFSLSDNLDKADNFYKKNGYVVLKKIFSSSSCEKLIKSWDEEVKPYKGFIYRQASNGNLEKNIFNSQNWVMNPILNLQSLNPNYFNKLRSNFENIIASNEKLANFINLLIGDRPAIVQSMYFEGNSATWEHQDSYYLDDEDTGSMLAGWIALEDIKADAGRFFVCPKSHLVDYANMDFSNIITSNHKKYIQTIVNLIKENNFEVKAPKLDKGDVLIWNALTIHGSLDSQSKSNSRSSITFHAIKSSSKFRVFRNILRKLNFDKNYPFYIFRPKDLSKRRNKIVFFLEKNFPKLFYKLKKAVIELKVK